MTTKVIYMNLSATRQLENISSCARKQNRHNFVQQILALNIALSYSGELLEVLTANKLFAV